jgi:hypothetical protein
VPTLETIVHYASIATCIGVVITAAGLIVAALSIVSNKNRSKKELAVNLVNGWARDYSLQMKQALDLADDLEHVVIAEISYAAKISHYKVEKVYASNGEVKVCGSANVLAIRYILKDKDPFFSTVTSGDDQESIILNMDRCRIIGYQWLSVLNKIEAICAAWDSEAADWDYMESLFKPLIMSKWCALNKLTSDPDNEPTKNNNTSTLIRKMLERYRDKQNLEQQGRQRNPFHSKDTASVGATG